MAIYLILDATHKDYKRVIAAVAKKAHSTFTPIPSNDGAKVTIQLKDDYPWEKWMIDRSNPLVIGAGDNTWVGKEMNTEDWIDPEITERAKLSRVR